MVRLRQDLESGVLKWVGWGSTRVSEGKELEEAMFVKRFLVAPPPPEEFLCSFVNWVLGFIISLI